MIDYQEMVFMCLVGGAGSLSMEILKAYELRAKLEQKKYLKLIKSKYFWLVTTAFIIVSGFFSWAFNENNPNATIFQIAITGMGASSIMRRIVESLKSGRLFAGEKEDDSIGSMFE